MISIPQSQNRPTRQTWIEEQYLRTFPTFARYVARRGGDEDMAKEVFQQALVTYYEDPKRPLITSEEGYLFGICKNLYFKEKGKRKLAPIDGVDVEAQTDHAPSPDRLLLLLQSAGERCLELLQSFYYERLSMQDLARRFGYRTERSATVQKYKCLENIRQEVKKRTLVYEDFID